MKQVFMSGSIAIAIVIMLMVFISPTSSARASTTILVGNDPAVARASAVDGENILVIESENPLYSQSVTDFQLHRQTSESHTFNLMILRPTGNTDEYSIVYDSGDLSTSSFAIDTPGQSDTFTPASPIPVHAGDLIGYWGEGIAFDSNKTPYDSMYYVTPGAEQPPMSGTFTVNNGSDPLAHTPDASGTYKRIYGLAVDEVAPEPASIALLVCVAPLLLRRRR